MLNFDIIQFLKVNNQVLVIDNKGVRRSGLVKEIKYDLKGNLTVEIAEIGTSREQSPCFIIDWENTRAIEVKTEDGWKTFTEDI
jgi:hypothetical protein